MINCELGYVVKNRAQFITNIGLTVLCREKLNMLLNAFIIVTIK